MTSLLPRVFVTVPGVEDLYTVVDYLHAAGAQITTGRREFVIEGPLTPVQVAATWRLSRHRDSGTEGARLAVRVEPAAAVDDALRLLCPEGFDPDIELPEGPDYPEGWWDDQQARQRRGEGWPPPPPTCCGRKGAGFPNTGEPLAVSCRLCEFSVSYWRLPHNRADGRPCQPVRPLGADGT